MNCKFFEVMVLLTLVDFVFSSFLYVESNSLHFSLQFFLVKLCYKLKIYIFCR